LGHGFAAAHRQGDLGAWARAPYLAQSRGETAVGRGQRGGSEGEGARRVGDGTADVGAGGVEAKEDGGGVFEEALAGGRWNHGTSAEERRTEVVFEAGDVLGDGRLGVPETVRGCGERAALGNRDERP
jgi:hypothetical protein